MDGVAWTAPAAGAAGGGVWCGVRGAGFLGIGRHAAGGVVIESHHAYRATRMVGAYLRGGFRADSDVKAGIAERYGLEAEPSGLGLRFEPERATWWRGFSIETAEIEEKAARRVAR